MASTPVAIRPERIFPAPAGLVSAADPQVSGGMWMLAAQKRSVVAYEMNLLDGSIVAHFAVPPTSVRIAQLPDGPVVVGTAEGGRGSLLFFDPTTHGLVSSVPVGGPVIQLGAGAGGVLALVRVSGSVLTLWSNPQGKITSLSRPPADVVGVALDSFNPQAYLAGPNGTVYTVSTNGRISSEFRAAPSARGVADDSVRSLLLVLKGEQVENVSVVDLSTQETVGVLPAPADCIGVAVSATGDTAYMLVGTSRVSNVQVFSLSAFQ